MLLFTSFLFQENGAIYNYDVTTTDGDADLSDSQSAVGSDNQSTNSSSEGETPSAKKTRLQQRLLKQEQMMQPKTTTRSSTAAATSYWPQRSRALVTDHDLSAGLSEMSQFVFVVVYITCCLWGIRYRISSNTGRGFQDISRTDFAAYIRGAASIRGWLAFLKVVSESFRWHFRYHASCWDFWN